MPDNITRICELAAALHGLAAHDLSVNTQRLGSGYWSMCITAEEHMNDPLLDSARIGRRTRSGGTSKSALESLYMVVEAKARTLVTEYAVRIGELTTAIEGGKG